MSNTANPSYRWVILTVNFFICAITFAGLTTWAILSPEVANTFQITPAQTNLGSSLFMVGFAFGSFIISHIIPKIGCRKAGLVALVLMLIGVFSLPKASSYNMVLVCRFFQGWGILWLVALTSCMGWFPIKQRGLASGVIGGSLTVGIGTGGLIATGLIKIAGTWQGAFFYFGCILLAFTVVWAVLMREAPKDLYPEEQQAATSSGASINIYKTPAAWLCAGCLFFNNWQFVGFNTIVASYMFSIGYTDIQAGLAILTCGMCGVVATPVGGILSDLLVARGMSAIKARAYVMAFPGFLVAAVTTFLFPVIAPISAGLAAIWALFVGWGIPVTNASIGALPMDLLGNAEAAGKMFGLSLVVGIGISGYLAPVVPMMVIESAGWTAGFVTLGVGALVGLLLGLLISRMSVLKA